MLWGYLETKDFPIWTISYNRSFVLDIYNKLTYKMGTVILINNRMSASKAWKKKKKFFYFQKITENFSNFLFVFRSSFLITTRDIIMRIWYSVYTINSLNNEWRFYTTNKKKKKQNSEELLTRTCILFYTLFFFNEYLVQILTNENIRKYL